VPEDNCVKTEELSLELREIVSVCASQDSVEITVALQIHVSQDQMDNPVKMEVPQWEFLETANATAHLATQVDIVKLLYLANLAQEDNRAEIKEFQLE